MMLRRHDMDRPFIFRLIEALFSEEQDAVEDVPPIGNAEFYGWLAMITVSLAVFGILLRAFAT